MGNARNMCGASIVIYKDDKILLQKRKDNGCWCYHGGAVEVGESSEDAARRELFEETGLIAGKIELIGVFSGKKLHHIYPDGNEVYIIDILYMCDDYSGEINMQKSEVTELKWFDIDDIPENLSPPIISGMAEFVELMKKKDDVENKESTESLNSFVTKLASSSPVPGGGGASALIGALGAALSSMVANLTSGKKKYAEYQSDIDRILTETDISVSNLMSLIQKDADVFEPLSKAYSLPKENPDRDEIMEKCLYEASLVPLEIVREAYNVIDIIEELAEKGSRLAVSDVGVSAAAVKCALEGAVMNVYINTKLMKERAVAERINSEADTLVTSGIMRCDAVYKKISDELRNQK